MKFKYFKILFITCLLFLPTMTFAMTDKEYAQNAIKYTAYTYYYREKAMQYDNWSLTYLGSLDSVRGQYYYSPETVTMQNIQYTVCSSFIYQVFYDTFVKDNGEHYVINSSKMGRINEIYPNTGSLEQSHISDPNSNYFNENIAVFYIDNNTYYKNGSTDTPDYFSNNMFKEKKADIMEDISSIIQPGDVIAYYQDVNTFGHVMVYLGDNNDNKQLFAESRGTSTPPIYEFEQKRDNEEGNGAINIFTNMLSNQEQAGKRFLAEGVSRISVFRPLNEINMEGYRVTDAAKFRIKYKHIYLEKTADVGRFGSVSWGDTIKYSVVLSNKSGTNYSGIYLEDIAPNNTKFINYKIITTNSASTASCQIEDNGTKLNCSNISLPANNYNYNNEDSNVIISYELRIDDNISLNEPIETPNTRAYYIESGNKVYSANLTNIVTNIGKTLTSEEKSKIINNSKQSFSNNLEYINNIYDFKNISFTSFDSIIEGIFKKNPNNISNPEYPNAKYLTPVIFCSSGTTSNCRNAQANVNHKNKAIAYDVYRIYSDKDPASNNKYYSMYIKGMYGGLFTLNSVLNHPINLSDFTLDSYLRVRYIKLDDFETGDLLVINDRLNNDEGTKINDIYIYIDNGFKHIKNSNIEELDDISSRILLDSLIGTENFVVLRPITSVKTIIFNSNNGFNETKTQEFIYNEDVKLNKNTFAKDEYTFVSWNTKSDGTGITYSDEQVIKSDKNLVLYAIWKENIPYVINKYLVDEIKSYISNIAINTTLDMFKINISLGDGYDVIVNHKIIDGKKILFTGGKTKIMKNSKVYKEYTNAVIGDINGDGIINSADLLKIRQHLLGINNIVDVYFLASDMNNDKSINSADLLRIRQHLIGIKTI